MRHSVLLSLVLAACTRAGEPSTPEPAPPSTPPAVAPIPAKTAPVPKPATRVELTAVTLADDCGTAAPAKQQERTTLKAKAKSKQDSDRRDDAAFARRCEQTSMQLAVIGGDAGTLKVKAVELFDDAGKSLGMLTPREPMRWSDATSLYEAWDESLAAGATMKVMYTLSQPAWREIADRWNKRYTLKVTVTIGGVDQTAQKEVTVSAPTSLPPNVKT